VEDLIDLTGEYKFVKGKRISGESVSINSKLIMEKEGENYKYTIDEIFRVDGRVTTKEHFEGTMSDKIFTVSMNYGGEWDWSLLGDNEIVERGGSFTLRKGHFDNNNPSGWILLEFDKDRGDEQTFRKD
tara:strand:+ start:285 stop:671 length:387 start_codon:yes stop_codon:yes gene_type:complete